LQNWFLVSASTKDFGLIQNCQVGNVYVFGARTGGLSHFESELGFSPANISRQQRRDMKKIHIISPQHLFGN